MQIENEGNMPIEGNQEKEVEILSEVHIRVFDNGQIDLFVPTTSKELSPEEVENLTFVVNKNLQEQRIAKQALEMFKSRLG